MSKTEQKKNNCRTYIQKMECYSAMKNNFILLCTTMWMNLENLTHNEISLAQKDIYWVIVLMRYLEWADSQRHKVS